MMKYQITCMPERTCC